MADRRDVPRLDDIEAIPEWPHHVQSARAQYEGEPSPDRLASGYVWLKSAMFALLPAAPFLALQALIDGAFFDWLAFLVWLVATLVSVVLVSMDDEPV